MTREQYERSRRQLEEQLRTGIALLEKAYHTQIAALDVVWRLHSPEGEAVVQRPEPSPLPGQPAAPAPVPPAPKPSQPRKRSASQVEEDVFSLLWRLPESFTRSDVCDVLGYEPDRTGLYRVLRELVRTGYLAVEDPGSGKRATLYRKTTQPDPLPST
jgi:hypothetical protein